MPGSPTRHHPPGPVPSASFGTLRWLGLPGAQPVSKSGSGSTALEESLPSVRPTAAAIFAPTPSAMLAARPIRPVLAETVCMSWKVTMLCAGMRAYTSSIAARSTPSTSNKNLNAWCGTCHNVMSRHCTTMMDTGGSTHHSLQRESTTIRWDHWRWIPVVEVRP